jgi:membrane protein YqaA with SNARE-associated domain
MLKNLLKKTVALAAHKSARTYLAFVCFIESIFFPIPPDVMLVPMTIARNKDWIKIATTASIASVVGGCAGYAIGHFFYKEVGIPIFEFYGFEGFTAFKEQVSIGKGYWAWVVLLVIAGFTPVPFKLLTISSGFINFNFLVFIVVASLTRGSRFFILAGLIRFFGHRIIPYIEKRSMKVLVVLTILLLLGFFIAYLIYNNYQYFIS